MITGAQIRQARELLAVVIPQDLRDLFGLSAAAAVLVVGFYLAI